MVERSRRSILRGATIVGAATLGGAAGAGTHALLSDSELVAGNALQSGRFDLQVAARSTVGDDTSHAPPQDGPFPSTFAAESRISVSIPEVDPDGGEASGATTVAFRACDNPGRVWLRPVGDADSALADALTVSLTYAATCGGQSVRLYEGSLSGLLDVYARGVQLGPVDCTELGTVELEDGRFVADGGDTLAVDDVPGTLTLDDGTAVDVEALHWKQDGEVRGVDLASDDADLCRVDVKGGGPPSKRGGKPNGDGQKNGQNDDGQNDDGQNDDGQNGGQPTSGVVTYFPGCDGVAPRLLAGDAPGGPPSALSNFTVYECAGDGCVGCDPACLTLDWTLADPASVAGESLSVDLELSASQCRNTEPTNPWQ